MKRRPQRHLRVPVARLRGKQALARHDGPGVLARCVGSLSHGGIKDGVAAYVKRFYESPASVLMIYGPPGTGKSSLIRNFFCIVKLSGCT